MIQRTPPAGVIERWQPELDRIAPRTERGHSHLRLVWEPGEEWAPVERWVVYEMMPAEWCPWAQEDLDGPAPRTFWRFDRALGRITRLRGTTISQRQWEIHRETGFFGRPIWIVQGKEGGHKRRWRDFEQNLITIMLDLDPNEPPPDPAAPGDLPYAEPDWRTIHKLKSWDRVEEWGSLLHVYSHTPELLAELDRRQREETRAMAAQVWGWLQSQVAETMTLTRSMVNDIWANADPDAPGTDYEVETEDFIAEVAGAAGT